MLYVADLTLSNTEIGITVTVLALILPIIIGFINVRLSKQKLKSLKNKLNKQKLILES